MEKIIWKPTSEQIEKSRIDQFLKKHHFKDLPSLQERSIQDPAWFWDSVVKDLGWEFYQPYQKVLDGSRGMAWAQWFRGGQCNLAHNCVDKYIQSSLSTIQDPSSKLALIWEGEDGEVRKLTYTQLYEQTNRIANALRSLGIEKGDRVGIFLPMLPETVASVLACAKVGAIFTPLFSGYGPESISVRLRDCEAKLLITADGFYRKGQKVRMKGVADEALKQSPAIEKVLVFSRLKEQVFMNPQMDIQAEELLRTQSAEFKTLLMDPEDPFMIIYTSGTTGKPKGCVHVHAGFPLKTTMDMAYCFDVGSNDTLFWLTDLGWMMGPWEIFGTLSLGGTLLLYEGAVDYSQPDRLWNLVEKHGVTVLGISPTVIRALMRYGGQWVDSHSMPTLRILGSTGEPWNPDPWMWFFDHVGKRRCPIINYTGGTEISGGILGCFPILPLKGCSFSAPIPGMAADVLSETAMPIRGEVGELVLKGPWPGMTRGFWKDPKRYWETYWSRWGSVWVHGDWASVDADGFWFLHGRSDDTIKVAGKRVGPAEVESVLVSHPAVSEAAVIGIPDELKGESVVCFCVLKNNGANEALEKELRDLVSQRLGKPLLPKEVYFVKELPKTRNAKIMRRVIKARFLNQPLGDISSLENPRALEEIPALSSRQVS